MKCRPVIVSRQPPGPDHPEKRSGPGKNVLIKKDEKQASVLKRSGQKHQDKKAQHLS